MKDTILNIPEEFISYFEGKSYKAYLDTAGIPTIGIGSTKNVTMGMAITEGQVRERFADDLHDAVLRVNSMVKIPLNDNEFSTMVDVGFNLSYKSSITLSGYVNTDKGLFKKKLLLYSKDSKGNYLKGLLIRRIAERLLFESRDWKIVKEFRKPDFSLNALQEAIPSLFDDSTVDG